MSRLVVPAPAEEPGLEGSGVIEDLPLDLLELGVQDDAFDRQTERVVVGYGAFLLDEGQDRLRECQAICNGAHKSCPPANLDERPGEKFHQVSLRSTSRLRRPVYTAIPTA